MHIYISIVDDTESDRLYLKERIEEWVEQSGNTAEIRCFSDGRNFIAALREHKFPCNAVFLDILMPERDGIQIADTLNTEFPGLYKVLYSSAIEYSSRGYIVNAVRYLLKNSKSLNSDIEECMEYIVKRMNEDSAYYYDASSARTKIKPILCSTIVSVVVTGNYAVVNTTDGEQIKHRATLRDVKERLPENFIICNRNTIVNARLIKQVSDHMVKMDNGEEYLISASHSEEFVEILSEIS